MSNPINVLLIEDDPEHARIISRHIRKAGQSTVRLVHEERLATGLQRLLQGRFDAILLDLRLPDSDIGQTLPLTVNAFPSVPIVVLSSLEDRELAIQSVHEGAQDYLVKASLSPELLIRAIYSAMERKQAEARIREQASQKEALFELSQRAIRDSDISSLIEKSLTLIQATLGVDLVSVLELTPDHGSFLLKHGLGFKESKSPPAPVPADSTSLAGHTLHHTLHASFPTDPSDLKSYEPVIVTDLKRENPFLRSSLLLENGAVSGMMVLIHGKDHPNPYGALGCFTQTHRIFSNDDANFLQAVANTLAAAILRHQLENELKQRVRDLDTAHRRKDEFLATLSHELRTPLNVMTGYLEILKTSEPGDPEFEEALSALDRNLALEVRLVADTLNVSRIITGKMALDISQFPIENVIISGIDSVRFSADAKRISIETHFESEPTPFIGDEGKIRQMVWNLMTNAVKFTPNNGHIEVTMRRIGARIELSVRDTGRGIAPESIPHVFERFWQEDSGKSRQFMGLGIGLALVRHVVELHGGIVTVTSEGRDRGSTFTVRLPLGGASAASTNARTTDQPQLSKSTPPPLPHPDLNGVRVLAIDDSTDSLMVLSRLLKKTGARIHAVSSPTVGLAEAQTENFDIVVSDIGMPGIDGFELMRRLRAWELSTGRHPLPAIALTAHANESDIECAKVAGYQLHLAKPVDIKLLEQAIGRVLNQAVTAG